MHAGCSYIQHQVSFSGTCSIIVITHYNTYFVHSWQEILETGKYDSIEESLTPNTVFWSNAILLTGGFTYSPIKDLYQMVDLHEWYEYAFN